MIHIKCVYFKHNGKYYCEGEGMFDKLLFTNCYYPADHGRRLREIEKLPGVSGGKWGEYFTCEVVGQYTELVLPFDNDKEV